MSTLREALSKATIMNVNDTHVRVDMFDAAEFDNGGDDAVVIFSTEEEGFGEEQLEFTRKDLVDAHKNNALTIFTLKEVEITA